MRIRILALLLFSLPDGAAIAAPLIYTGYGVTFSKAGFANESNPANQDRMIPGIALTRASSQGLFNIAVESSFVGATSPTGTRWAFKNNNGDVQPNIADWATLTFEDWQTSLGGTGSLAANIIDGGAVVHLVDQDIYLELRFTDWGIGSGTGGSFSYERSEITPTADFDRDGDVDGQDFLTWQRGAGMASPLQSQGDANFDGVVDAGDLAIWQSSYGNPLAAIGAVPEPTSWVLAACAAVLIGTRRRG
jgi:hypothetical protein